MFQFYTKKDFLRSLVGLGLMVVVLKATGGAGFVIVFAMLMAAVMLGKPEKILYLFLLSVAMTLSCNFLVPKGIVYSISLRLMNLSLGGFMIMKLAGMKSSPLAKPFLFMLVYLVVLSMTSMQGWCPTISEMKLILYFFIYIGYYGVALIAINASSKTESKIRSILLAFAAYFIVGSTVVIPIPAISIMNPYDMDLEELPLSLFQGITSHAQCLGPCVAILTTMIFADLVYNIRKPDKLYLLMLFCAPILLYKTASRTAMGSCLFGMMVVVYYFLKMRGIGQRWRGKVMSAFWGCVVVGLVAAIVLPGVRQGVKKFVLKFGGEGRGTVSWGEVTKTRAGKWETTMYNFHQSPFVGNGFQVSESMAGIKPKEALRKLSAPVEKGVWVSAVLEEGGVLGFSVFVCFILLVFAQLSKHKAYTGLATFLVMIVSNMGEFTVFSMTYTGGLQWAVVFCSLVLDAQRLRAERISRQMPTPPPMPMRPLPRPRYPR